MSGLRWRKVLRDMRLARTRMIMIVVALAVSVSAVGGLLSGTAILMREVARNYAGTIPASATIELGGEAGPQVLAAVQDDPAVLAAAARRTVRATAEVDGRRVQVLLFGSTRADPGEVSRQRLEKGEPASGDDTLSMERSSLAYLGLDVGDQLRLQVPGGAPQSLTITGAVHDAALSPSAQETVGYAYLTVEALQRLGDPGVLNEVKVLVAGPDGRAATDVAQIEEVSRRVSRTVSDLGVPVEHIEIPPPMQHPHQTQMDAVSRLLLVFGGLALLLSAVLTATMVGGLLAQQVRQIGAMKTVGATSGQLLRMYLALVGVLAAAATALAVLPAGALGRTLSAAVARLLNIDLADVSTPGWVWGVLAVTGLVVPMLTALVPITAATRRTVRDALDDHGTSAVGAPGRGATLLTRLRSSDTAMLIALRNLTRRRGRLALTVGLLASAGTLFVASVNTVGGWNAQVDEGLAHRTYDVELRLAGPSPSATAVVKATAGVTDVEPWLSLPTSVALPGETPVDHTYPDGGHNSFTLVAPPDGTTMLRLPLLEGRWLEPGDTDAVVLNQLVGPQRAPGVEVGDRITLTTAGRNASWLVVGIASDFGSQGTAYVMPTGFAAATGQAEATMLRVRTAEHDAATRTDVAERLQQGLAAAGVPVVSATAVDQLRGALDGHVLVLVDTLLAIALVMAVVGLLGLTSTMSTNVVERTRELGVMSALGATPRILRRVVAIEGVALAALSAAVALLAALPLTLGLGRFIGQQAFHLDLPVVPSPVVAVGWTVLVLAGAALATTAPARRAARLTVREAIAHV